MNSCGRSSRLRNIEETEKAKRQAAEERKERKKVNNDEEHLVATRCTSLLFFFFLTVECLNLTVWRSLPSAHETKVGRGHHA
jgi:hypothetical protein